MELAQGRVHYLALVLVVLKLGVLKLRNTCNVRPCQNLQVVVRQLVPPVPRFNLWDLWWTNWN